MVMKMSGGFVLKVPMAAAEPAMCVNLAVIVTPAFVTEACAHDLAMSTIPVMRFMNVQPICSPMMAPVAVQVCVAR